MRTSLILFVGCFGVAGVVVLIVVDVRLGCCIGWGCCWGLVRFLNLSRRASHSCFRRSARCCCAEGLVAAGFAGEIGCVCGGCFGVAGVAGLVVEAARLGCCIG